MPNEDDKTPPTPTEAGGPPPTEVDWKAKARAWEQRAKDNKNAAEELAALKAAQMTEQQRAQADLETARREAAQARAEAMRFRVAAKHQVSDEDAELFLTGADEATLTRQAERLAEHAAQQTSPPASGVAGTPRPDSTQGARPAALNDDDGLLGSLKAALNIP